MLSTQIKARVAVAFFSLASIGALTDGGVLAFIMFLTASFLIARYDEILISRLNLSNLSSKLSAPTKRNTIYPSIVLILLASVLSPTSTVTMPIHTESKSLRVADSDYVKYMNTRTEELWDELHNMKNSSEFHTGGLNTNNWEQRRKSVQKEWLEYSKQLPTSEKIKYGINESLSWMNHIAKDLRLNKGKLKDKNNRELADKVQESIENGGRRAS